AWSALVVAPRHVMLFVAASFFFFSSRRRHTRFSRDWSSDVCSSDLTKHWLKQRWPASLGACRPPGWCGKCELLASCLQHPVQTWIVPGSSPGRWKLVLRPPCLPCQLRLLRLLQQPQPARLVPCQAGRTDLPAAPATCPARRPGR